MPIVKRPIRPHEKWKPSPGEVAAVYMATDQITGRSYVGFTAQALKYRIGNHIAASTSRGDTKFCRAILKYGRENFDFIVLRICSTIEEARIAERQLITILKPEYNSPLPSAKKPIICVNDGKAYESATDAAKAYGLNRHCVAGVASKTRVSIFGYKFEYVGSGK